MLEKIKTLGANVPRKTDSILGGMTSTAQELDRRVAIDKQEIAELAKQIAALTQAQEALVETVARATLAATNIRALTGVYWTDTTVTPEEEVLSELSLDLK